MFFCNKLCIVLNVCIFASCLKKTLLQSSATSNLLICCSWEPPRGVSKFYRLQIWPWIQIKYEDNCFQVHILCISLINTRTLLAVRAGQALHEMILSGPIALSSVGFINLNPLFFFYRVDLHSHPPQTLLGLAHGCLWWHVFILVGPSYGYRQMFVLSTPFLLFPGLLGACVSSMLVLQHSHGLMCCLFRLYRGF